MHTLEKSLPAKFIFDVGPRKGPQPKELQWRNFSVALPNVNWPGLASVTLRLITQSHHLCNRHEQEAHAVMACVLYL